jgi:hypothetical protein
VAQRQEYVVETDFLFGLRASDRLHSSVCSAMMRHVEGGLHLLVSGASPVEANAVMASQGVPQEDIVEAFSLIATTLQKHRVERFTCITISDVQDAMSSRQSRPSLTFFDSLHAAISKRMDLPILSSDPIYRELGVEWVDLRGY